MGNGGSVANLRVQTFAEQEFFRVKAEDGRDHLVRTRTPCPLLPEYPHAVSQSSALTCAAHRAATETAEQGPRPCAALLTGRGPCDSQILPEILSLRSLGEFKACLVNPSAVAGRPSLTCSPSRRVLHTSALSFLSTTPAALAFHQRCTLHARTGGLREHVDDV